MTEHDRLAEAREALERIRDYFDQRADADAVGDPMRYQGNAEMHMLRDVESVEQALASARASAYEDAAKVCEALGSSGVPCDGGEWCPFDDVYGGREATEKCAAAIRQRAKRVWAL